MDRVQGWGQDANTGVLGWFVASDKVSHVLYGGGLCGGLPVRRDGRMLNPWVIIGVLCIWAMSLYGVGKWQRADGASAVKAECLADKNEALRTANAEITRLNADARARQEAYQRHMEQVDKDFTKERQNAEARRRRDVAAARDGALVLRVPASVCGGGVGQTGEAGSSPGGGNGSTGVELPRQVTEDLLNLAADADQVADQLRACQSIIVNDRKEVP